ncbi:protein kinase [bacterium]|nr:protein kinase [bacterium]
MIGSLVSHYRIIKKIGSGGMGEVYLAEDTKLDRIVALKILLPGMASQKERMARFVQEARAASSLDHPNLATVYEIGDAEGTRFIAMQYVEGQTLSDKLRQGPLPISEVIDIALQIVDALNEAHSKGIVHRDLKPSNIMITPRGQAKILDFGLAKYSGSEFHRSAPNTEPGIILGSIQYMSPEQSLGRDIDRRTDFFSFGIVLYEMITGKLPFRGETPMETLSKILSDPPEPYGNLQIPWEVQRIIGKCLEKEPDRRYQTAKDLMVDLNNLKRDTESGRYSTERHIALPRPLFRRIGTGSVLLLLIAAAAVWFSVRSDRVQQIHSLAVLPFSNESKDTGTDYLSDGITDSLINRLSQLPNLKVLARGTVFTYKNKVVDPRDVGRELQVDAVVTGSIYQLGEDFRVQVSLVSAADGAQMWGKQYNRKLSDIFQVQTDISSEITQEMRVKLTGEQEQQLQKNYTENVEAYRLYLKGRYYLNRRNEESFLKAIESFQEAIAMDPDYALAYAGLADCYALLSNWGFWPAKEGYPKAKNAALKALSLDNSLAEAYISLATVKSSYEWNWKEAEADFLRGLQLNPNYATGHLWYSFYLLLIGRNEESLKEVQQAQVLDPLSLIINANRGYTLYVSRRYPEAREAIEKTLELDPNFAIAYEYLAYTQVQQKRYSEAVQSLRKALRISPDNLTFQSDLASVLALNGQTEEANLILNELLAQKGYVPPVDIAAIYISLGNKEKALEWLEKAYEMRNDQITYINKEPRFDLLRSDPRFQDLLHRIGF